MEPITPLFTAPDTTLNGEKLALEVVKLGAFRMPSGTLAASDGLDVHEPHRTAEEFTTDDGFLELAVGSDGSGAQRVLAARVQYVNAPVVDWTQVFFRGAPAIDCDSGSILFGDTRALPLNKEEREATAAGMESNNRSGVTWSIGEKNGASFTVVAPGAEGETCFFFRGIDAGGATVALVMDFAGILQEGWE